MKCPNCGTEMESGYALYPGFAGIPRIVKLDVGPKDTIPQAVLCHNCGKLEWFLPPEKIPFIKEI